MAVASKNLFTLLQDDAADVSIDTPSSDKVAPSTDPQPPKSQNKDRGRGNSTRGGRYYNRGGKSSAAAAAADPADENDQTQQRRSDQDASRPRGRGRGGRGGRGRGGDSGPRRGREFDRQSGTLPVSEKRVHQGWGGDDGVRELQSEQQAVADATAEVTTSPPLNDWAADTTGPTTDDWAGTGNATQADGWDAPSGADASTNTNTENKESGGGEFRRRRNEEEEEDNTLTLDQYLAQQKGVTSSVLPQLEGIRKANEGSDHSLWKVAEVEKTSSDDNYFIGKTKTAPKARARKAEKEIIEIEARFDRPDRGRVGRGRGRGGDERGRGRGGRGRGGERNTRNTGSGGGRIDVDDQSAFPSLS